MIVITGNEYLEIDTDSPVSINFLANVVTEFRQAGWEQDHTLTLQASATSDNKKLIPPPLNSLWEIRLKQIIIHNVNSSQVTVSVSYYNGFVSMKLWEQVIQPGVTRCII
jgi:hypothetical protein